MTVWDKLFGNWGTAAARQFDAAGGASGAVELTKRRPTFSLTKQGAVTGNLRVNLSWRMRTSDIADKPGFGSGVRHPFRKFTPQMVQAQGPAMVDVDLDLACLYELQDGSKGVVQPLGNILGSINSPPYVQLSGDDRFGSGSGETIYINMDHRDEFKRLLIFVYIYDGTPAFDRTHAMVTLYPGNGPRLEVELHERAPEARSCAVLLIENRGGEIVVRRELKYVYGFQAELDRLYGWGLQWGRGYKTRV
ncbi:Tellurium resistance [Streptomyces cinnamoneus]|uniref:Tellurium resistance n=1 Tax=Streptomyces cinnamoneus TaxID=53446 RepID=A0A2G1XG28_STRCJ|nr:Tellurium resistance [Streptomyces cinnamoneus]PHQ50194.1 Tellurium resistance [Streptomyces cinnamoneus]PPT13022.1 Tellurium resistance [Streptomyces cinnamoneus]